MRKIIRALLIVLFSAILLFSAGRFFVLRRRYETDRETYSEAVSQFTKPSAQGTGQASQPDVIAAVGSETLQSVRDEKAEDAEPAAVTAPIEVDFHGLTDVNSNIIGWIYCEGTIINYPVVYGVDNSYYLNHDYRGNPDNCGTIFSDANNLKGFEDSNVILYGHHMSDMSMFATLKYWLEQDYFDEHPVMWLLTPTQDYMVELFAVYEAQADSETYTIFRGPGALFDGYLSSAVEKSRVRSTVEIEPESNYLLLSTCAYSNALARTVVHGKLVPVDSAGGLLIDTKR